MSIVNTDINSEALQRFQALFGTYESTLNGQKSLPIHSIRIQGMDTLRALNFPTLRHEDWKYTSLSRILQHKYELPPSVSSSTQLVPEFLYQSDEDYLLVFENGRFNERLSKMENIEPGLHISTLEEAAQNDRFSKLVNSSFQKIVKQSNNPFVHLNAAFSGTGVFIHVEKGIKVQKPIHLLHLSQGGSTSIIAAPILLAYTERSSELTIMESYHSLAKDGGSEPIFQVSNCLFELQQQSKICHYKLQALDAQDFLVHHGWASQHRDSTFTSFTADLGGRIVRNNMSVVHEGENVMSNLYGVFVGDGDCHIDNQTLVDHALPHCQSNEWYKGILSGKSRGVFNGKVMVRKDAQKTNAFQQNNALILSADARMDTKPQLEIFADDVKCSHGATIGQMDESAVFYLRSRGLSESEARSLLQLAFIQEVTGFIEDEGVKDHMERWISSSFYQKN